MAIYGQYNGFKNYNSNYYARAKFFTMPRPSSYVKNNISIDINNYGYGNNYGLDYTGMYANYGIGGYNPPSNKLFEWMIGISVVSQLFNAFSGLFGGGSKKVETPTNPEEIGGAEEPPTVPTENPFEYDINAEETEVTVKIPEKTETKATTTEVENKSQILSTNADGSKNALGYTWTSLGNAYKDAEGNAIGNTSAFRAWFRENVLNGATDIGYGVQHYPNEIEIDGVKYSFNKDDYKPTEYVIRNTYSGTSAHTEAKTETTKTDGGTRTEKQWKSTATATWTDKEGKKHTVTKTVTGQTDEATARNAVIAQIKAEVPAEYHDKIVVNSKKSDK